MITKFITWWYVVEEQRLQRFDAWDASPRGVSNLKNPGDDQVCLSYSDGLRATIRSTLGQNPDSKSRERCNDTWWWLSNHPQFALEVQGNRMSSTLETGILKRHSRASELKLSFWEHP